MRQVFIALDDNGDGKLTKDELINGLSIILERSEAEKEVNRLIEIIDVDGNGFIEYEEFLRACVDKKEILTENNLKYAFKFLDQNGSGKLNAQKILYAFMSKEKMDKKFEIAIENEVNEVDGDGDGEINFDEFKKLIFNNLI